MNSRLEHKRLESLFKDLERLAADPASNAPEIRRELETLRARLLEIEKQLQRNETSSPGDDPGPRQNAVQKPERPANFILYEQDRVGYLYNGGKLETLHDSEKDLPNLNNAIVSPLIVGGQPIGGMQIAPPPDRPLTAEEMELAQAVAQQASLQIQNLRLLAAAERSRAEAENATRRFIHESWDSYLDAIHQSERVGYVYDQTAIAPYTDRLHANGGIRASVNVMDEQIGELYLKPDSNRPLTDSDRELIHAVAERVAQQVENIRLLADAARARAEAEQAIRRLTRENWDTFTSDRDESELGFVYDSLQVVPLAKSNLPQDAVLSQPLLVRGEAIGQLAVAGLKKVPPEATGLMASIATQASAHLETLRLNEELQKRARELQELDRLKSAFLANMSHELRTPLNSILGFTDVMLEGLDGKLTPHMDNDLRLIQKNGQHLLHLINDVLDMAKIESGRMNLHPETFKVHSVLDEVVSITSTLASEKNLALFIEPDSDQEIEIYADNTRLRQVMINLVNNSIKFTETGHVSIQVEKADEENILIVVHDTGLGIPRDKLNDIFNEFTQVDTTTTRKAGGTGLGLPISRRLVEMHGGTLWAESAGIEGHGSTFYVKLPIEARIAEVEKQEKK